MRVTANTYSRNNYNLYKMLGSRGAFNSSSGMGAMLNSLGGNSGSDGNMANLAADFSSIRNTRSTMRQFYNSVYGTKRSSRAETAEQASRANRLKQSQQPDLNDRAKRLAGILNADKTGSSIGQKLKVGKAADGLTKAAEALTNTDTKKSLFEPDKNGKHNMDAIYAGVQDFVKSYNTLKNTVVSDGDSKAVQKELDVVSTTKALSRSLSNIGITVNSDNSLSVNAEKLKKADLADIKAIFNGKGSYADNVRQNADQIKSNVTTNTGAAFSGHSGSRKAIINMLV